MSLTNSHRVSLYHRRLVHQTT